MELSRAHRAAGRGEAADLELRVAHATLERLGVALPSPAETPPATYSEPGRAPCNALLREGDTWALTCDARTIRVGDRRGIHYLARLLAEPGRGHHVLDLVAAFRSSAPIDLGDAGPHLDATAKAAYRRRLADIDEDIADAERNGDLGRAECARNERELLVRELARAFGATGHARPGAGAAVERARVSVTRAIRQAIAVITERHPAAGEHLASTIKTGVECSYAVEPQSGRVWTVTE